MFKRGEKSSPVSHPAHGSLTAYDGRAHQAPASLTSTFSTALLRKARRTAIKIGGPRLSDTTQGFPTGCRLHPRLFKARMQTVCSTGKLFFSGSGAYSAAKLRALSTHSSTKGAHKYRGMA